MNILITAGGTTEQIDAVRSITNTSTGILGSLIAKTFAAFSDIEKIYYICGKTAVKLQSEKAEIIPVDTVASLEAAVRKVLKEHSIDIIVHSMAVSDYRVKLVTSASLLADSSVSSYLYLPENTNKQITETSVISWLEKSETVIGGSGKISSDIENMILLMERTPKIISLFRDLSPGAVLVGFKLLDHVQHDVLIDAAFRILKENKCSFVLANDLRDICSEQHTGYLVNEEKSFTCYTTKQEIADAIAAATIEKRRNIE